MMRSIVILAISLPIFIFSSFQVDFGLILPFFFCIFFSCSAASMSVAFFASITFNSLCVYELEIAGISSQRKGYVCIINFPCHVKVWFQSAARYPLICIYFYLRVNMMIQKRSVSKREQLLRLNTRNSMNLFTRRWEDNFLSHDFCFMFLHAFIFWSLHIIFQMYI